MGKGALIPSLVVGIIGLITSCCSNNFFHCSLICFENFPQA